MPDLDRVVAGLRCRDVLEQLSEYLDGDLPEGARERIRAHLAGCDACERFGGEMGAMVALFRRALAIPPPVTASLAERLRARLRGG
ncbi:MAG TPA: zf-HC2 domain-containing protein [Gemmatimonadales bacterium]|jgi:anti-sigma factor RsiW|nr:zf-HC2 domain-containing protein [Gemmatimonadales bacterium]